MIINFHYISSGCKRVKIRKNVKNLTAAEKKRLVTALNALKDNIIIIMATIIIIVVIIRLVNAMQALIDSGRYQELANIHSGPFTICPEFKTGRF